jgi:hypothetical protein
MANSFELEGTLKVVDDVQNFDSGFTKREFVVEVEDGKYPQMIKFECVRDKTSLTDGLEIGDPVKVTFDVRGNEWKGRYFVNLNAWKLEKAGDAPGKSSGPVPGDYGDEDAPPSNLSEPSGGPVEEDDDIPF